MKRFNYTDPVVDLPKLELAIVELRSFESMLALYHAEELRKSVIDMVLTNERLRSRGGKADGPRLKRNDKEVLKKALRIMEADGAVSEEERKEIGKLINFRNDIGHRLDQLFYDLEQRRFSATDLDMEERKLVKIVSFDHSAFERFQTASKVVDRACMTHYRAMTIRPGGHLYFSSTERALRRKIKAIRKRIPKLFLERRERIRRFNSDLEKAIEIIGRYGSAQFNLRFPEGRMTKRGSEICYRLFDAEIDELVIAQLFEMKLPSVRRRKATWRALGGKQRTTISFDELPDTIVPSRFDDG